MPSLFAELETLVSTAIDTTMGEPTKIERQKTNQYFANSADGTRPVVTPIGIVDYNPVTVTATDEGQYDGLQPQLAGERIHVSYALSSFLNAGDQPLPNDIITATGRPDAPKFRITRVDPDGIGRIICVCVKA